MLCRIEAEAGFGKQIGTLEVGMPLPPLRFEHEGEHAIDMLSGGKVIATRSLMVEVHR